MALGKSYSTGREILFNFRTAFTLPATIDSPNTQTDSTGHRIVKAGTPLGGSDPFPQKINQKLTPSNNPSVILMHDVDLNDPLANGEATVIVRGQVRFDNMDKDVQALYTSDIFNKLPKIDFVNGSDK